MADQDRLFEVRHHRQVIDYVDAPSLVAAMRIYEKAYPGMSDEVAFVEVEAVQP